MTNYVVAPPPVAALPVVGSSELFPLRRVYCVGRNYAAHAREMGFDPTRDPPFFFAKPADSVIPVQHGETRDIRYPSMSTNYQFEVELVAAIGKPAYKVSTEQALEIIFGYAVGLDMTRRDLQLALRDKGRPWELGKAFDESAPCGPIHPVALHGHPKSGAIWLKVDDTDRQRSELAHLIWSVAEIVSNLSQYFRLVPGDVVFTGTPDGVGPVLPGQKINAGIDGLGSISICVIADE
ncbi:MAG: fumarylacetoacetate hydrolase family protein [Phenylobacterium sp.]|jgi:fumarylpyruvate hydrolase|nr:fumarylacetoacetate hydrolase family protein [Phenylobacterium sp.]